MVLKSDQKRVRELLKETITLLCKNGLNYKCEFSIEALIGITLDQDDIFLVSIKETIRDGLQAAKEEVESAEPDTSDVRASERDSGQDRLQSYAPSPRSRGHSSTGIGKRSSSSSQRRDGAGAYRDPGHRDRDSLGQPPVKRSHTEPSHHQFPGASDVVVIKEESLSDPELEQAEMGGQFDATQDFGTGPEGMPPWMAGAPMMPTGDMSGVPGPSGMQMSPMMQMSPFLGRTRCLPPALNEAETALLCYSILRMEGCFATARVVRRRHSRFVTDHITTAMQVMSTTRDDKYYIGEYRQLPHQVKVFYKCPPFLVKPRALEKYRISAVEYSTQFHLDPKPTNGAPADWEAYYSGVMEYSPYIQRRNRLPPVADTFSHMRMAASKQAVLPVFPPVSVSVPKVPPHPGLPAAGASRGSSDASVSTTGSSQGTLPKPPPVSKACSQTAPMDTAVHNLLRDTPADALTNLSHLVERVHSPTAIASTPQRALSSRFEQVLGPGCPAPSDQEQYGGQSKNSPMSTQENVHAVLEGDNVTLSSSAQNRVEHN